MKIIAVSSLAAGRTRDELASVKDRAVRMIWDLIKQGILRNVYQRREQVGVVLELEVADGDAALQVISQLPAMKLGILKLDELIVCDPFTAVETLFAADPVHEIKPESDIAYDNPDVWADDFEAVLKYVDQPAVIVAWSMSGSYLGDYIAKYGASRIAGINFSGDSNTLGTPLFTSQAGAAFGGAQGLFSDDLGQQMQAYASLNTYLTSGDLDIETAKAAFAWLTLVPLVARRVMFGRDADHRAVYRDAGIPILASHGRDDKIVIPRAAEMLKETVPSAELYWYDYVGHTPHWERYERFNRELAAFAARVFESSVDSHRRRLQNI